MRRTQPGSQHSTRSCPYDSHAGYLIEPFHEPLVTTLRVDGGHFVLKGSTNLFGNECDDPSTSRATHASHREMAWRVCNFSSVGPRMHQRRSSNRPGWNRRERCADAHLPYLCSESRHGA